MHHIEDSSAPTTPVQFKESWIDGASDCIPPSSSTVFPSSPYPQTPLDDLPSINPDALDHNVVIPYSVHRIYAPEIHAEKRDAGHELDGPGGAIEDFSPCIDGSLSPVVVSSHSTDTSGHTFFSQNGSQRHRTDDELGLSPAINLDIHSGEAENYSHTLNTHAAQVYFSLRLDRLLLQVLDEQNGHLTDKATFCPAVSPESLFSLAQSASGLDSSFSASNSMDASDSLSHDNAIISAKASVDSFSVSSLSVSSLSASHTSSRSVSSSSVSTVLPATDQDSESSYEVFSPVKFTGRYVYDTHPDEDQECDGDPGILSSSSAGSDQVPSVEAEYSELWSSRNDPSLILRTPVTYKILDAAHGIVPLAPRKMQVRTRYLGPDACSQQSSLSKRSRPLSPLGSWEEYHDTDRYADTLRSPTCRDRRQEDSSYRQETLAIVGLNEVNAPQTKKRKLATQDQAVMPVSHIPCRRDKEPTLGSLRRASSLRSDAEEVEARITDQQYGVRIKDKPTSDIPVHSPVSVLHPSAKLLHKTLRHASGFISCPPTQPLTPVRSRFNNVTPSDSPLPILAPPPYEMIPRAPASKEQEAERRISKLLSKELEERIGDGLNIAGLQKELMGEDESKRQTHDDDDEEERMWRAVGKIEDSKTVDGRSENTEGRVTDYIEEADPSLGIEDEFRKEVIEWILDVIPPKFPSRPFLCSNLRAQLSESPDTRWHAAHLFMRYFRRVGVSPSCPPIACKASDKEDDGMEGPEAITWDLAVACLALAVKLHRDFLDPLYPVVANEYLILAPHTMTYEDLEAAQRDLFSTFSFSLGISTPGAYIEEIHNALPSLRTLLCFRGNWDVAIAETWEILFDAQMDLAYIRYPTHVLTACALILGIIESLVLKAKADSAATLQSAAIGHHSELRRTRRAARCDCQTLRRKARKAVGTVTLDVRELFGISEPSWESCRLWLDEIVEGY